jgi:hypothetical protein
MRAATVQGLEGVLENVCVAILAEWKHTLPTWAVVMDTEDTPVVLVDGCVRRYRHHMQSQKHHKESKNSQ